MKYIKIKSTGSTYIDNQNKDFSYCNELNVKLGSNSTTNYIPFIRFGRLNFNLYKDIKKIILVLKINELNFNFNDFFLYTISEDFNLCDTTWNNTANKNLEPKSLYKIKYYNGLILIDITDIYKSNLYINKKIFGFSLFSNSLNKVIYISNTEKDSPYITIEYKDEKVNSNTSISKVINQFDEKYFCINSRNKVLCTDPIKISDFRNATFFVKNNGISNIYIYVEISPDGINFVKDLDEKLVSGQTSSIFVVARFLKYTRLKIVNENLNTETNINIWFQGQKYNYKLMKEVNNI